MTIPTTTIGGVPYYELDFGADGSLDTRSGHGDGGLTAAAPTGAVDGGPIGDLFVLAHGWGTDPAHARDLFQAMFTLLADQLGPVQPSSAFAGVIWPSLLFPDDSPDSAPAVPSTGAELAAALAPAFAPAQQEALATMGTLLDTRPQEAAALDTFHRLATSLVTTPAPPPGSEDANQAALLGADTNTALSAAATLAPPTTDAAQGLADPFSLLWTGAREVLRTLSYYEMKNRAAVIGRTGLGPLLAALATPAGPPRIYLMGHSFGARLVASTLAGMSDPAAAAPPAPTPVKALYLIQGAFSHFSFADPLPIDATRSGLLAQFRSRVDGPLLATFTGADRAVGTWYPAASLLEHQDDQGFTDDMYRWGAMGHDGYQEAGAVTVPLGAAGTGYGFNAGQVCNLDANAVICADQNAFCGAHGDIYHPEVTWPIASVARAAAGH